MQLENGIIGLEFDDHTGSLRSVRDLRTGEEHLPDTAEATLFRLIIPAEQWQSRYADAQRQTCRLERRQEQVILHYDAIQTADGATLPISVKIAVELPAGSAEAWFQMTIRNDSTESVAEVCFPRLGGWTGLAGPGKDVVMAGSQLWVKPLDPHGQPLAPNWTTFLRMHQRWAVRYPLLTFLPWIDVSGGGRGLWIINYMREARVGGAVVENMKGYQPGVSLTIGWFGEPEIGPGAVWESARFGVGLHEGDWHATARRYREWLKTWWHPPASPRRLYRSIGVQNVAFTNFDGEPVRPLSALPDVARSGLKYGVRDLCVWDYLMLGTYGRVYGAEPTAYSDADWETLRRGLAEARQMGVTTSMLINYRLISPSSDYYKAGGAAGVIRLRDGSLRSEPVPCSARTAEWNPAWMGPAAQVMCQKSPQFRSFALRHLDRLLDVGFDAFFIDQPFENIPCYAPDHGHASPDDTHHAVAEWVGEFRRRLIERCPDGYIIGEMPDVWVGQVIDVWWNWFWPSMMAEVMPYTVPGQINSYVTDADIGKAQQGFLHGFLLMITNHGLEATLDDTPQFAQYVRALADLRARTAHCTTEAEFADVDDLTCYGAQAKRFNRTDGGIGVTIINPTDKLAWAKVTLERIAPRAGARASAGRLHRLDGRTQDAGRAAGEGAALELQLEPREAVVWEPA